MKLCFQWCSSTFDLIYNILAQCNYMWNGCLNETLDTRLSGYDYPQSDDGP